MVVIFGALEVSNPYRAGSLETVARDSAKCLDCRIILKCIAKKQGGRL
jgi:hypothetical protein